MSFRIKKEMISTQDLINQMVNKKDWYFEASLNDGYFNATHFLCFRGKRIYDTGIDSQDVKWKIGEFLELYPLAKWKIDQIV